MITLRSRSFAARNSKSPNNNRNDFASHSSFFQSVVRSLWDDLEKAWWIELLCCGFEREKNRDICGLFLLHINYGRLSDLFAISGIQLCQLFSFDVRSLVRRWFFATLRRCAPKSLAQFSIGVGNFPRLARFSFLPWNSLIGWQDVAEKSKLWKWQNAQIIPIKCFVCRLLLIN